MTNVMLEKPESFIKRKIGVKDIYTRAELYNTLCEYTGEVFMETKKAILLEISANISAYTTIENGHVFVIHDKIKSLINDK